MTTAVALVTICFTITASATDSAAFTASSAASAECRTAYRTTVTAIPGKMTRPVAPIAHNSGTHDWWKAKQKKKTLKLIETTLYILGRYKISIQL